MEVPPGIFALATVELGPNINLGGIWRVSHEEGSFEEGRLEEENPFAKSCRNGIHTALSYLREVLGPTQPTGRRCTLRRLDNPHEEIKDPGGGSAGLAAGLAAYLCWRQWTQPPGPAQIAATGRVTSNGEVLEVDHLIEKLEGLLREAPSITTVCIPEKNLEPLPGHIQEQLQIIRVNSVREAIRWLWPSEVGQATEPSSPGVNAEQPLDPEVRSKAMALPIACRSAPARSFVTRLIYPIRMTPESLEQAPAGWRRMEKIDQGVSYFSKLKILETDGFRRATEGVLFWRECSVGSLPLVFELNLNLLHNQTIVETGPLAIRLRRVDLIPLQDGDGATGLLSFCFEGGACTLGDYLKWVSLRDFGKIKLQNPNGDEKQSVRIGGFFKEIKAAISSERSPQLEAMSKAVTLEKPRICQFLLSPEDQRWPTEGHDPVFEAGWRLAASFSRLNDRYPKGGGANVSHWTHDEGLDTRYGIHPYGITAWAHAAEQFNRETKSRLVCEALYLLWIVARNLAETGADPTPIRVLQDETVRLEFFQRCFNFFKQRFDFDG